MATSPTIIDDSTADTGTTDTTAQTNDTTTAADTATTTAAADATTATTGATTTEAANDDWRTKWAGEDKDALKFLGRFHSPDAAVKAWKKQNDDLKAGKFITPLPENPTDAEVAAYRKQLGVPEAADGYLENLDGLVIGDDDKPIVGDFAKVMHDLNAPPGMVKAGIEWYYNQLEEQAVAEADRLSQAKDAGIEALREEWGADYRRNLNIVTSYLGGLPEGVSQALAQGTGPGGVPLGSDPEVIKWLAGLAMEANPVSTVVPGAGANQATAIADEIASIEKMMRENRTAYNKDEKTQARYRELIEAKLKLDARG